MRPSPRISAASPRSSGCRALAQARLADPQHGRGARRAGAPRAGGLQPTRIVLEASGGYEQAVDAALIAAGLPAVVVNPRQVRDFARSVGNILAKPATPGSGPLRGRGPCARGQMWPPATRPTRRRTMRVAEQQRAPKPRRPSTPTSMPTLGTAWPTSTLQLAAAIQAERRLRARAAWLQSIPGIGPRLPHPAGGTARARHAQPETDRRPRRRRPVQSGQRRLARAPLGLGWARVGPRRALYGRACRQPGQPEPPRLLPAPRRGRQAQARGPHRRVLCNALCKQQAMWDSTMPNTVATPRSQRTSRLDGG